MYIHQVSRDRRKGKTSIAKIVVQKEILKIYSVVKQ